MVLTAGVDVGGTKIAAGLVDEAGRLVGSPAVQQMHQARSAADVVAAVVGILEPLVAARADVIAVGVGAAGFVDAERQELLFAPNLPLRRTRLRELLAQRLGLPVVLENDANCAAWAEYRFGAGQGAAALVAVTVGTGIGGALVSGGALYRGGYGIAGEFGHLRVVSDGLACGCGNRGCWEQYCSGPAL
ncbi:MAG: ROK family protein, partial [Mycobacteriales bacterium]